MSANLIFEIGNRYLELILGTFTSISSSLGWPFLVTYFLLTPILILKGFAKNYVTTDSSLLGNAFPLSTIKSDSFRQDFKIFLFTTVIWAFFLHFMLPASEDEFKSFLDGFISPQISTDANTSIQNPGSYLWNLIHLLSLPIAFDIGYYISHLAMHRFKFLWEFHKLHHSVERMSYFTDMRFHPVDTILLNFSGALGMSLSTLFFHKITPIDPALASLGFVIFFGVLFDLPSLFFHSGIWWSWGKAELILQSPAMHILHHSKDPKHHACNLGFSFSFMDRICGTIVETKGIDPRALSLGIEDSINWNKASMVTIFFRPFLEIFRKRR